MECGDSGHGECDDADRQSRQFPLGPLQAIQAPRMDKWFMGWLVWLLFAMAGIHVFVTQLEFVFYSAAAFVTVPFATWNRTAWISERTFGAVLSVGVKLMVLYTLTSASIPVLKHAVLPAALTQQDSVFMIARACCSVFCNWRPIGWRVDSCTACRP